jgi:hypothetical protein
MAIDGNLAKANNHVSHKGAPLVRRSLQSPVDQQSLIDSLRIHSHARRLKKKLRSSKLKNSPNIFQSTGTNKNHLRPSKRIKTILDDRLKRFRMLDPDEFQEMLNSFSHQIPDQQLKEFNSMDTIGGMQLESKFLHSDQLISNSNFCFLDYWSRK